jgi:hypothetical protein
MADYPARTIRLVLPSTAEQPADRQAWVEFLPDVLLEELDPRLPIEEAEIKLVQGRAAITTSLARHTAAWNLTSRDGEPLPVTPENLGKLSTSDCRFLLSHLRMTKTLTKEEAMGVHKYIASAKSGSMPGKSPPFSYQLYAYRKRFNVSYSDLMKTPYHVMLQDLQFEEFERVLLK